MKRFLLLLAFAFYVFSARCQTARGDIRNQIVSASFDSDPQPAGRPWMAPQGASRFNPITWMGAVGIFIYQRLFSEQIQASCAYEISCSEFTKKAIAKRGVFVGLLAGITQLSECTPAARHEHPPLYVNQEGKITGQTDADPL